MGNKEEITNLIGRKGSKMTVKSNVKTLALKVYDEQIPDGWEKLKERIKELKKAEYQCLGIKHDEDVLGDDFFEPSTEKPHYHILIRVMQDAQNVIQILNALLRIYLTLIDSKLLSICQKGNLPPL